MYGKLNYLHLGENIDPSAHIIVEFYVESSLELTKVAEALASESSIGTWTDLTTVNEDIFHRLAAKIFYINEDLNLVRIAYPLGLFENGNIPQMLSDVAGNVFGMKEVINLRVRNIQMPEKYLSSFSGPAFGVKGIRSIMDIPNRPLLGTIIKPKVGLDSDQHAKVAYEAWLGGVDIVKDDENLSNQDFNPFNDRVVKTLMLKKKAEDLTGRRKMYVPNISAPVSQMCKRAEFVKMQGGCAVMMDILTVGFSGVQYIRDQNLGLILHGHRAMHGAFTHNTKHGIAMLPIAKLARLSGIDQLHTGTVVGKMEGDEEEVDAINDSMWIEWFNIKPTMPIASGGLHPGHISELIKVIGSNDFIMNLGGGIHGHPGGTQKGARAAVQAIDASMQGISLDKYSKDHEELAQALDKWGSFRHPNPTSKSLVTYTYGLKSK